MNFFLKAIFMLFILLFPLVLFGAGQKGEAGKTLFYVDFNNGYDNNVNLDSSESERKEDFFSQFDMELGYECPFSELYKAKIDYYLNSKSYYKINEASFYDNNIELELTRKLTDIFTATISHNFESLYYPDDDSDYFGNDSKLSFRHDIKEWIYQKLSYDFISKDFYEQKTRDKSEANMDFNRKDLRNCLTHELGIWVNDTSIKLKNKYYRNDSNDEYMDYYDYSSYRVSLTISASVISDKFLGTISGGYQIKEYDERLLVDSDSTQKDNSYDISASLHYDISKTTSLSLNCSYSENNSNESSEDYSDTTTSFGIHYVF
ncbi:MAG: hypothetical protein ABIK53_08020 [bacterium]